MKHNGFSIPYIKFLSTKSAEDSVEKKIFTDQIENEYKKSNGEMTKEMYEEELEAINEHCTEIKEFIDYIKNNDYYYLQTKNEINKRKEQNTNILRQYGLNI